MPTGTAFVTVFMTFAGKAYIAVMETVLSVQAVVKRSIRSTFLFKYDMSFHFFGYSGTVLKNLFANGFKNHIFIKRMLNYVSFIKN